MRELYNKIERVLGIALLKMILMNVKDFSKNPQGLRNKPECQGQVMTIKGGDMVLHFTGYALEGLLFDKDRNKTVFVKRLSTPVEKMWVKPGPISREAAIEIFQREFAKLSGDDLLKLNMVNLAVRNCIGLSKLMLALGQLKPGDFRHKCFMETVCGEHSYPVQDAAPQTEEEADPAMEQCIAKEEEEEVEKDTKEKRKERQRAIMRLAHHIRRRDELEGNYSVQMKIALKMAYAEFDAINNTKDKDNKETKEEVKRDTIDKPSIKVAALAGQMLIQIDGKKQMADVPGASTIEEVEEWILNNKDTFFRGHEFCLYYATDTLDAYEREGVTKIRYKLPS